MTKKLTVLFATNFSTSSKDALKALQYINQYYDTDIYLLHVIKNFWRSWLSSGLYEKEQMQRLQSWQMRLTPENARADHLIIQQGNNVPNLILAEADRLNVDLIVIGGHNPNENCPSRPNRVANPVVAHAKQSVLLCKNHHFKKVLCGIDGSTSSAKSLATAIRMCSIGNATLSLAHVLPRLDFNPLGMPNKDIVKKEQEFKDGKIKEIEEFLSHFDFQNIAVNHHYSWGQTSRVMLYMAEDFDYDLIVIGATGQSMLSNMLMGGTAQRILKGSPCSLLIIR